MTVLFDKTFGRCVDWQWAAPNKPLGCRRKRSCGAAHVDFCPLAERKDQEPS